MSNVQITKQCIVHQSYELHCLSHLHWVNVPTIPGVGGFKWLLHYIMHSILCFLLSCCACMFLTLCPPFTSMLQPSSDGQGFITWSVWVKPLAWVLPPSTQFYHNLNHRKLTRDATHVLFIFLATWPVWQKYVKTQRWAGNMHSWGTMTPPWSTTRE